MNTSRFSKKQNSLIYLVIFTAIERQFKDDDEIVKLWVALKESLDVFGYFDWQFIRIRFPCTRVDGFRLDMIAKEENGDKYSFFSKIAFMVFKMCASDEVTPLMIFNHLQFIGEELADWYLVKHVQDLRCFI